MIIRHILDSDLEVIELLKQLTFVGDINIKDFKDFINNLENKEIYVIEDNNKIIGTGSIFYEKKIIHNFGIVAHIEDIVIDKLKRGNGIGKFLINKLLKICKDKGVYKVILNCNKDNERFYQKCGLEKKDTMMVKYF